MGFWEYAAAWQRAKAEHDAQMAQSISSALSSVGQGVAGMAQNAQSNKLGASTFNTGAGAPRAGLVAPGVNPSTGMANTIQAGTPTAGTQPAFLPGSGKQGLALAMQQQKEQQTAKDQNIRNALVQAQTSALTTKSPLTDQDLQSQIELRKAQANALSNKPTAAATAAQRQQNWEETHADTMEKFSKDLKSSGWSDEDIKSMVAAAQGPQGGGSLTRGRYVTGPDNKQYFVADPQGDVTSLNPDAAGAKAPGGGFLGIGAEQGAQSANVGPILPNSQAEAYLKRYQNIASAPNGRYVPPIPQGQAAAPQAAHPAPAAGGQGPVKVSSMADIQKLAPGTVFQDWNGKLRQVPSGQAKPAPTPAPGLPGTPGGPQSAAQEQAQSRGDASYVGADGVTYVRQPDGSYKPQQ